MRRQNVVSSNLRSVGFDPISGTLEIAFKRGGVYQYYGVPEEIYSGLLGAASKGRYHARFIKNRFRYRKISN